MGSRRYNRRRLNAQYDDNEPRRHGYRLDDSHNKQPQKQPENQFNEKTQTFTQRITDFASTRDNEPSQQDKSQIGKTSTAKARMLLWDGKPDMLELTDQASGEKQSYFKQDLNKLREILKP